jgi:hypothetical protein
MHVYQIICLSVAHSCSRQHMSFWDLLSFWKCQLYSTKQAAFALGQILPSINSCPDGTSIAGSTHCNCSNYPGGYQCSPTGGVEGDMDCHACPKSDAYPKLSQTECTVCLADSNGIVSGDKVFNILELLLGDKVFPCLCKLCQLRVGTIATLQEPFSTQEIFVHWWLLSWRIQFPYFIFNPKFFRLFKLHLSLCCRIVVPVHSSVPRELWVGDAESQFESRSSASYCCCYCCWCCSLWDQEPFIWIK